MKHLRNLIVIIALIAALAVSAEAVGISSMESHASVATSGACQVSVNATVHLDKVADKLTFPVPGNATGITLNGSRVSAPKSGGVRNINLKKLTGNATGDFSFHIAYSLPDVITTTEEGLLQMQVPLLSGCSYPVEAMGFSVTLPGTAETLPSFVSGYHQSSIEQSLTFQTEGATVSGSTLKALKDHETLTMTMMVSEEMFPQSIMETQDYTVAAVAMGICGGLALLYWLCFMAVLPTWPKRTTQPPSGSSAGNLGCIVGMQGIDLPMLIVSWANLGYVLIHLDRKNRVILHKRMEMGNERSDWERTWFRKVFGNNNSVNTAGVRFARLWQAAETTRGGMGELLHRRAGSGKIFRFLAAGIGLFGGAGLGLAMGSGAVLKWVLVILFSLVGAWSGFAVQAYPAGLFLRHRHKLWEGLILCGVWLIFGLLTDTFLLTLWTVIGLLIAGQLLFWGGRRTPMGKATRGQVLDLKRYLRKLPKDEAAALTEADPDYFFRLAPEALALGVDREFARAFGAQRYPGCPYLTTGMDAHMTALQWNAMLRRAVEAMDSRGKSLQTERFIGLVQSLLRR